MSTNKTIFAAMAAFLLACGSVLAQAPMISIPIADADFESQSITGYVQTISDPAGCGTDEQGQITGWIFENVNPGSGGGVAHWTCDDGMPNSNVAFLGYGARMYQITSETARQGTYVLRFDAASWFMFIPVIGRRNCIKAPSMRAAR